MQKIMKRMGVKQEDIEALEVVIKTRDKNLIIRNPHVSKINMMGQESLQVTGDIEEEKEEFNKDDIKTVMQQTNCTEKEAIAALEKKKDIAAAIISLKHDKT